MVQTYLAQLVCDCTLPPHVVLVEELLGDAGV